MEINFTPSFLRIFNKLDPGLQDEVEEKIELFKVVKNHERLKVHKLKGKLIKTYSFSVNYRIRIIFEYNSKQEVTLLTIGDHDVYT